MPLEIKKLAEEARQKFHDFYQQYRKIQETDDLKTILQRQLPKICKNETSKVIIEQVDKVLSEEFDEDLSIEHLHAVTYCAAQTVVQLCEDEGVEIFPQEKIPKEFPKTEEDQKTLYKTSVRRFKRLLYNEEKRIVGEKVPTVKQIEDYWSSLWEEPSKKKDDLPYPKNEEERMKGKDVQTSSTITEAELKKAFKTRKNWSPAGIDGLQVFWYRAFPSVKNALLVKINHVVSNKEEMPDFFTVGITSISPKDENTQDPKRYRPITHLPTIYKIIMRCVYQKIFAHYEQYGILAEEQCGGRRGCFGVRKALVIDSVALNQERVHGQYVDIKKAFDSVSHDWLLEMLRVYKVDETLVSFLENTMKKWKTKIQFGGELTRSISFKRGVFQGDPMSVLLFWTALNPLSFHLRGRGLPMGDGRVSHVLYMDDLKLYAESPKELEEMYKEVEGFVTGIGMEINTEKKHLFVIPSERTSRPEVSYLGYTQNPKINNEKTIGSKTTNFSKKSAKIDRTKISQKCKSNFKRKFLYNYILNTFGVLDWKNFDRQLQTIQVKKRFLRVVKRKTNGLNNISMKFINEMCRMRREFSKEATSEVMRNIIKCDNVTPLMLSIEQTKQNEEKYVNALVEKMKPK